MSTTSSILGTVSNQYDAAGRRTRMDYPGAGSFFVTYQYNGVGDLLSILQQGSSSVASFAYDNLGRRTEANRGGGWAVSTYSYDAVSRLAGLDIDLNSGNRETTLGFSYNPASQIVSRSRTNSAYDWITPGSSGTSTVNYTDNGLNQYTAVGSVAPTYDGRGNLTSDGSKTYGYNAYNQLTSVSGGVSLAYDALGRLREVAGGSTTRFLYDGADLIAEYDGSGNVLRRYVHGPGVDEPLVWYEGSGTSDRRWPIADERGSVVAITSDYAVVTAVNSYDAFGAPASGNVGRFGYTGQIWLPEAGLWHYKARAYHPGLGRFLQTDPIGVAGGLNLYGYTGNDPVNRRDPSGLCAWGITFRYEQGFVTPTGSGVRLHSEFECFDPVSPGLAWYGDQRGPGGSGGGGGGGGSPASFGHGPQCEMCHWSELEPPRLENMCPVAELEASFGIQLAGKFKVFGLGAGGRFDAATPFRFEARLDANGANGRAYMSQGLTLGGSATPLGLGGLSWEGTYGREGDIHWSGTHTPGSRSLAEQPFELTVANPFVGIEGGLAILFGVEGKLGLEMLPPGTPCN